MPRATVNKKSLIGLEATPDAVVVPSTELLSTGFAPVSQANIQMFAPAGSEFDTTAQLTKEWSQTAITYTGNFTDWMYLAAAHFGLPVTTTPPDGVTARQHIYTPKDVIQTFAIDNGDAQANISSRSRYNFITELVIEGSRNGVMGTATALGKRLNEGITLATNPTVIAKRIIDPNMMDIWVANDRATLDAMTVNQAYPSNVSWAIRSQGRWNPTWFVGSKHGGSHSGHIKVKPNVELEMMVANDADGQALKARMRANAENYVRILCTGPIIEGAIAYLWEAIFCGAVKNPPDTGDEDGLDVLTWTLGAIKDATQFVCQFRLINAIAAMV